MKTVSRLIAVLSATALWLCPLKSVAATIEELQRNFENPPDDAKIMMRWWWFGPAVTKPQLEHEMRAMKEGGIGGFEVQPTYPLALDDEAKGLKNLKFNSPEFLDMLAFTAAKAKELGLRFDLTLGSGWPYGGPQFTRNEAVAAIRNGGTVNVAPGQTSVARPASRGGRGGAAGANEDSIIAVLLGPVTNAAAGASPYIPLEIRDNSAVLPTDLRGATQVTFYTQGLPGLVNVKRPAFGADGFIIDHYSPPSIEKFIKEIAEPALKACGPNPPYAIFCDSLEVNGENWTPNFLSEFQKRRGYDLKPLLPALFGDVLPKAAEIRHDWGQTCTELFNEYFNTRFQALARQYNTRYRIQGYGAPPAALHSYAYADLNEAEGYQWRGFDEARWAASASHLLGRPVTSSETWTWLHSPVFMANPLDLKAEADLHFLQGINQLIGHGWPYTHPSVEYPGWRFYASGVYNDKNPWWIVMPDLAKYLQRVSYMLRQGTPANDVLVYLSNSDAWANFHQQTMINRFVEPRVDGVTRSILDAGYNLDYFDDQLLAMRGKVEGDTITFGDAKYRAVVLPGVQRIPLATLRKLEEFANKGGIVIATKNIPSIAPGYKTSDSDIVALRWVTEVLFGGPTANGILIESESDIGNVLSKRSNPNAKVRLAPAAIVNPASPEIGIIHRQLEEAEVFFIANTQNTAKRIDLKLNLQRLPRRGYQYELWEPVSGAAKVKWGIAMSVPPASASVPISLEPYGSVFLVLTDGAKSFLAKRTLPTVVPERPIPTLPPLDLSRDWRVSFKTAAGDANPLPVQMDELKSWTDDESRKFFSGVATYEKQVTVPAEMLKPSTQLALDFGEAKPTGTDGGGAGAARGGGARFRAQIEPPVREAAVVYVNGQRAGSVWHPPYRVDVTGLLKSGENQLRIEVANLAVNYMAGRPQEDLTELRRVYGNRFDPQDMNQIRSMPAGLLSKVQLVATGQANK